MICKYRIWCHSINYCSHMAKLIGNVTYYFRYLVLIEPASIVPRRMLIQAGFTLSARATAANYFVFNGVAAALAHFRLSSSSERLNAHLSLPWNSEQLENKQPAAMELSKRTGVCSLHLCSYCPVVFAVVPCSMLAASCPVYFFKLAIFPAASLSCMFVPRS